MTVEPFKPEHLDEIDLQAEQTSWRDHRDPNYARELSEGVAVTAREAGRIVACAGVLSVERDVGFAWAFVARGAGRHFVRFRGMVRRLFEVSGKARILASTECTFSNACRWLEILGFTRLRDEPISGCWPNNSDHFLYVKVL